MILKKSRVLTSAAALLLGLPAGAHHVFGPEVHGSNVDPILGNCDIGTFPQIGKAGQYNGHCDQFTDAEKCLALIKQRINTDGSLSNTFYIERTEYCLETFKKGLISEDSDN